MQIARDVRVFCHFPATGALGILLSLAKKGVEEAARGAQDGQAGAWGVGGEAAHGVQLLGRGVSDACLAGVRGVCVRVEIMRRMCLQ
jgi:hypothetical protein